MLGRLRDSLAEHGPSKATVMFLLVCAAMAYGLYRFFNAPIATPAVTIPAIAQVASPPAASKPPASAASDTDRIILSLFKPSPEDLAGFSQSERIRERYRTAYISLYLLKGCGENVDSYHAILARHFSTEWASLGGDNATPDTIYKTLDTLIQQAAGSYSMLYQNTPCDKRNLPALRNYFRQLR